MSEEVMFAEAIDAVSKGQRSRARDLLTRLLRNEQENPTYWLWMSSVVESKKEKIYCLENTLRLDPTNVMAQRGLVLFGAQPESENITPTPIINRKWSVEKLKDTRSNEGKGDGLKSTLSNPTLRIVLYSLAGIIVFGMIFVGVFGLGSNNRRMFADIQLTVTPKPWTPKPTATLLPTNTPRVKTPTPTFIGPTPLWMLLEATYTPTPLYVDTPHPISEAYRAGLRAYHSGEVDEMLQFMEQAAAIEPESADTHYYIGEAHRVLENFELALAAYETAISTNQLFAPAYLGRARIYLQINPELGVEDDLIEAISLDPNLVEAYLALADYYLQLNDPESALETLEYFNDLEIVSPYIPLYKAQAHLLLDEPNTALEFAQQALELDQTLLPAYLTLGQIYLNIGFPRRAIDHLETYTSYITENAEAWALLGESYYETNQAEEAMNALDYSIEIEESNYKVHLIRGYIYLDEGEGQLAVNEFFNARSLDPDSFEACVGMAHALLLAGRQGDALRQVNSCQMLVIEDKQQVSIFYHRAIIFEAIGNYKLAAEDWLALLAYPTEIVSRTWKYTAEEHLKDLTPTPTPTSTPTPVPITQTPNN